VDDDPVTATGYAISDNRTAELAEWDDEVLGRLLGELRAEDVDLHELGWSEEDLDSLLSDLEAGPDEGQGQGEDPGPEEPPEEPVSQRGEVYALGPGRTGSCAATRLTRPTSPGSWRGRRRSSWPPTRPTS